METTFVIDKSELDEDFLASLKKLYKHGKQLQITVSVQDDFNLTQKETPRQYLRRLKKCLVDMENGNKIITITDTQLDELILDKV